MIAEVPGLEEKDVEVLLEDGVLTLRGERNRKPRTRIVSSANATTGGSSVRRSRPGDRRGQGRRNLQEWHAHRDVAEDRNGAGECQAHRDQQQQMNPLIARRVPKRPRREASAGTTNANRVAERRAELERLAEGAIHSSLHGTGDGKEFSAAADRLEFEGIVSKQAVLYRIGWAESCLKANCFEETD